MTPQFAIPALGHFGEFFAIIFLAAVILLRILFTTCIANDINLLRARGRPIIVLTPFLWVFAVLMLGLVAVAFYWLCHYSRFNRKET